MPHFLQRQLAALRLIFSGLGLLLPHVLVAQPTRPPLPQGVSAAPVARAWLAVPEAAHPCLAPELRQVLGQSSVLRLPELRMANPGVRFSQQPAGGALVLVRIMARNVDALLPALRALGFEVMGSAPALHFVEGQLPVPQLGALSALASQGLLGVVAAGAGEGGTGLVTSQADYVLEADRARATRPRLVTGSGITVGVLSDSFNRLGGAPADVASGDLPVVNVLTEYIGADSTEDEGRAMCQLVHDLAPGAGLAFSTAKSSEVALAQHIRDLASPSKGNCQVIVDDWDYYAEPMYQDGVVAQAVTDVVTNQGVAYFASAGNYASKSYENNAPQFVASPAGVRYLNFDPSGATQAFTQRITIADKSFFRPYLQWADPFYTVGGVRSDLDMFLVAVRGGVATDTVAASTIRNIRFSLPLEYIYYTNQVATTGTTTFELVITLKQGQVPARLKYINYNKNNTGVTIDEWNTASSTATRHSATAAACAVAAVPYFNQRVPEVFTSRGGALPLLFAPDGTALATPTTRQKPDLASIDGTNTTFFGRDYEGDGYPNFFGTSAAAPHAAAVAALLRAAEPSLTPSQVYSRLVGSARPLATTLPDPFTGPGLLDAFATLYGPVVPAAPPIAEGLEQLALPLSWVVSGTGAARAQVTGQAPATGQASLVLDAYPYIRSLASLTEATLYVQGAAGASNLLLQFSQRKFVAETDDPMPAQFTGHSNSDGVALSVDGGTNWYRIVDLTGFNATTTFQTQALNLTQLAGSLGLTVGSDVRIRFQRYGQGGATAPVAANAAGRDFDDIMVSTGVLSSSPLAKAADLQAWPVPAPTGSSLHVQLPAFQGNVKLQLLDNLGRLVWQRQLTQADAAWVGTLPLPATAGLYNLLYQPEGSAPTARRVVVQ